MYRLVILLFVIPLIGNSQTIVSSDVIERNNYEAYKKSDWKSTLKTGKMGIRNGSDYFNLRLRMGIAYYNCKKYRLAEKEFRKALKFDSYNDLNQEYLYLSYLKNESYDLGMKYSRKFNSELSDKMATRSSPLIPLFYMEGGQKISDSTSFVSSANYFQIGFSNRIGKSLSLSHAFTNYSQKTSFGKINQQQYYLGVQIPIAKTFLITPSVHILHFKLENEYSYVPSHPPFMPAPKEISEIVTYTENNIILSVAAKKSSAYFDVIPALSYSNLNLRKQYQGSLTVVAYPFGSNKFSLGATTILQKDSTLNGFGYRIQLGYQPINKFKISASYYNGNMLNYNEDNGFVANNSFFYTNYKVSVIPEIQLSKRLSVYGIVQRENKSASSTNNFNYTTILFGLKLKTF